MTRTTAFQLLLLAGLAAILAGCDPNAQYCTPERYEQGLVLILPGIEGVSGNNVGIQQGLNDGGVDYALQIYPWGFPVPGVGMLVNQTDVAANRAAGARIAEVIVRYQQQYPGKPVFLVGHSGGGGVAVFTLEQLGARADGQPIKGAILISSSISSNYNLAPALAMTQLGILNVYNGLDTGLLGVGTGIFGNVDGGTAPSAGRTGFSQRTYHDKLFELGLTNQPQGIFDDPHTFGTQPRIVRRYGPNWILATSWPPAVQYGIPNYGYYGSR
jgi:pimeloyl-ACP methyl ester carboxylesterase